MIHNLRKKEDPDLKVPDVKLTVQNIPENRTGFALTMAAVEKQVKSMNEQKEYSVFKEIGIVFSIGFSLGLFILVISIVIVEFLK